MNKSLSTLTSKTETLEDSVAELNTITNKINKEISTSLTKNFLNLTTNSKRKIFLTKLSFESNNDLSFQISVTLKISSAQSLTLQFHTDKSILFQQTFSLEPGRHQLALNKANIHLFSLEENFYLTIESLNCKQIILESINLLSAGANTTNKNISCNCLDSKDGIMLYYCANGDSYLQNTSKDEKILSTSDFTWFCNANKCCFAHDRQTKKTFMFRIDIENNLFYSDLNLSSEKFIDNEITDVSAVATKESIVACYIKNNSAFVVEFVNGKNTEPKLVSQIRKNLTHCYLYFNPYTEDVFLILTDSKLNNYLLKSEKETSSLGENISAETMIEIKTYEVADEN